MLNGKKIRELSALALMGAFLKPTPPHDRWVAVVVGVVVAFVIGYLCGSLF